MKIIFGAFLNDLLPIEPARPRIKDGRYLINLFFSCKLILLDIATQML